MLLWVILEDMSCSLLLLCWTLAHVHMTFRCRTRPELTRCVMGNVKMVNSVTRRNCFRRFEYLSCQETETEIPKHSWRPKQMLLTLEAKVMRN